MMKEATLRKKIPQTLPKLAAPEVPVMDTDDNRRTLSDDFPILTEDKGNHWKVTIPCASALVDNEHEINDFLQKVNVSDTVNVSFVKRRLTVICEKKSGISREECIRAVKQLLQEADDQFDLLPVCMCCDRAAVVQVEEHLNGLRTICGICMDEERLHHMQVALVEKQRQEAQRENREMIKQREPIFGIIKAGALGGLYACGLGLIFMILSTFLPMFHFMPCFPGAVAGVYMASRVYEEAHYTAPIRLIVGTLSAFLVMFAVSSITVGLFSVLLKGVYVVPHFVLFPNAGVYNLAMGGAGYALGTWFTVSFQGGV